MTHPSRTNGFLKVYYLKLGLTSISALNKLFFFTAYFLHESQSKAHPTSNEVVF